MSPVQANLTPLSAWDSMANGGGVIPVGPMLLCSLQQTGHLCENFTKNVITTTGRAVDIQCAGVLVSEHAFLLCTTPPSLLFSLFRPPFSPYSPTPSTPTARIRVTLLPSFSPSLPRHDRLGWWWEGLEGRTGVCGGRGQTLAFVLGQVGLAARTATAPTAACMPAMTWFFLLLPYTPSVSHLCLIPSSFSPSACFVSNLSGT